MKRLFQVGAAALFALATLPGGAIAQSGDPIKIALVHGLSGSTFEVFSRQTQRGFELGLEYGTGGSMQVLGRKIEIITKDTKFKPDVARAVLAEAYGDDEVVLAVGATSSGITKAMLPVAEEYGRILLIEPAVSDSLTGADWNRFVFKTSRNSSMDMYSQARALRPDANLQVATLADDYAFGRDAISAFKEALQGTGASLVQEEYVPLDSTDLTSHIQRVFDALKDKQGRKVIVIYSARGDNPLGKVNSLDPGRFGIEISTGGNILPALASYKILPGMEGSIYYYYELPKNEVNDWLVKTHQERYNEPPDFFHAGGFAAAMAVVAALKKANSTDTQELITAMEGLEFDTPKGKMWFRPEDHQAMQSMYHFKIRVEDNVNWAIPELVREIRPDEMSIPIRNKR